VVVGAVVALLVAATVVVVVAKRDGGTPRSAGETATPAPARGGGATASSASPGAGESLTLLDGRLIVAARPGWEKLESSTDTASVKLALHEATGRELLATLIFAVIPGNGSLDRTLAVEGGTGFEAKTSTGPLRAMAVPGPSPRVVAGTERPNGTFFLSLSIFATDGNGLDLPLLKKLFTEQVAPALRFT